jgi:RND family efflux transporter MFP subunit
MKLKIRGELKLMSKLKITIAGFLNLLLFIFLIYANGCGSKSADNKDSKLEVKPIPVNTAIVIKGSISQEKTFSGTLEGIEQASIISKISERITDIKFNVNDYVKKDDVIIELDKSGPTSSYLQTQASFINSQKDYERMKALIDEGAVSQQRVDQAKTAYDVTKANFDAAKSTVELTTPISGTVTDIKYNVGDWVTPGSELGIVANINEMVIKFFASEIEMRKIKMGETVKIYSEFDKINSVEGKIYEISRSASSDARAFQVKAKFNNSKNLWFKPGMFVSVDVVLNSQNDVLIIPTPAITFNNNKNIVYRIKNNQAFPVEINTGISNQNNTEVISGLSQGDMIVIMGMNNLQDSSKVSIVK